MMNATLVDLSVKLMVVAATASLLTRKASPEGAAAAHRIWIVVILSPFALALTPLGAGALVQVMPDQAIAPAISRAGDLIEPWGIVIYPTIAMVMLARLAAGILAVDRLVRSSSPLSEADGDRLGILGVPAAVRVRESSLVVPVTAGVIRPVILLPRGWRRFTGAQLAAICAHECAHVRRRDYAWGLVAGFVEALLWFHPGAWFAARRLRWFAEVAADREAAGSLGAGPYAASLAELATGWARERRIRYAVTVGAHGAVVRRLQLLGREAEGAGRPGRVSAALMALACVGLMTVSVRTTRASRDLPEPRLGPFHFFDHRQQHQIRHPRAGVGAVHDPFVPSSLTTPQPSA